MWPVFVKQFNSEFLINDTGEVQLITSFLHFYWAILSIFGFIKKLLITALRTNLEIVNVASIHCAIQLRVFEKWWRYCTISTDRSHLVMRDAHSSLTLMFMTSGDVWLNEFFDQIVHKIGAKRLKFFLYLQSQLWGCSQVLVMCDESQIGSVHEALWCVMWTIDQNGTVVLLKFSSVWFSPYFLRTENRTDRFFSELNRTRTEPFRTGSNCQTARNFESCALHNFTP